MKRIIFSLVLALGTLANAAGQGLSGDWSGPLNVQGQALTLVFHLALAGDAPTATFDSPDQGARGIEARVVFASADSVCLTVPRIGARFAGHAENEQIIGTFAQSGYSFPLTLTRGYAKPRRPQTPQPPFPYETREISFLNAHDSVRLAGTLTLPACAANEAVPCVVMVSGSGLQNRDEEIFDHKPFLVLADYLARRGIASLRYDDRGCGESKCAGAEYATTADFARDAAAALDFVREEATAGAANCQLSTVNCQLPRIGILGHSEGANIALMMAAQGRANFAVSLAAVGVRGDTALTAQANALLAVRAMPQMSVSDYRQNAEAQGVPWLNYFLDYDPSPDIHAARCPVFALNGANDWQVLSALNLSAIRQKLPANPQNQVREYPGLNHLFQHALTGLPEEYGKIEETLAPEVMADIANWILGLKN